MTNTSGAQVWQGGFEPFGADYSSAPTILRLPGQWYDPAWSADLGGYLNANRWYDGGMGLYTQPDPLGGVALDPRDLTSPSQDNERFSYFTYVEGDPIDFADPLGLFKTKGCDTDQETAINESTQEFCGKLDDPSFPGCCEKPVTPRRSQENVRRPLDHLRMQARKNRPVQAGSRALELWMVHSVWTHRCCPMLGCRDVARWAVLPLHRSPTSSGIPARRSRSGWRSVSDAQNRG